MYKLFLTNEKTVNGKTVKRKDDITQLFDIQKYFLLRLRYSANTTYSFNTIGTIKYQEHHIKESQKKGDHCKGSG